MPFFPVNFCHLIIVFQLTGGGGIYRKRKIKAKKDESYCNRQWWWRWRYCNNNVATSFQILEIFGYTVPTEDDEQMQEELGDLIDDNPIEEDSSSSESDNETSGGNKRKRDDDDDELDDRLSEEDFELIEENLGIKMKVLNINYLWKTFTFMWFFLF